MLPWVVLAAATAAVGAAPEWAVSNRWPGCPPSSCWVGVGSSDQSADKARQAAIADIAHQVRARIKSDTRNLISEGDGKSEESSSARSSLKADERLEGVKVVESARDGETWYTLAVLERSTLAAPGRAEMEKAEAETNDRLPRIRAALQQARVQAAAEELAAVEKARRRFVDGQKSAALGEPDALQEEFPLSQPVRDSFQRELRAGLKISSPDSVRAGGPATEIPVSVVWKGAPAADLELELSGRDGKVLGQTRTGEDGRAVFAVADLRAQLLSIRFRSSALPSTTRNLLAVRDGSDLPHRLVLDPSSSPWRAEISDVLLRSGWRLDARGAPLAVSLRAEKQGEISGFSGNLVRMRVQLTLQGSQGETSCSANFADSDPEKAVRAALRKLDCPQE